MKNTNRKTNWVVLSTSLLVCLVVRLVPFRAPNVEPILATQMPFAKLYGGSIAFLFGFLSVVLYDIVTGTGGVWTLVTATSYGVIGYISSSFFKSRDANRKNFVTLAVVSTLVYDVLTGLTVGPLVFHQSFMNALVGQIPFTALHLFGNIIFALLVSPAVYTFLLQKQESKSECVYVRLLAQE